MSALPTPSLSARLVLARVVIEYIGVELGRFSSGPNDDHLEVIASLAALVAELISGLDGEQSVVAHACRADTRAVAYARGAVRLSGQHI